MIENMDKQQLEVEMFAHFSLKGIGGILDEENIRSEMLTKLLAYIIFNRDKDISAQGLMDVLWPDEDSDNPAGALKNLVYRLRNSIKQQWGDLDFIITRRGAYRWNEAITVALDCEAFEKHCQMAAGSKDIESKKRQYMQAIELYKGGFLPQFMGEHWVTSLNTYYHSMYLSAVKEAAFILEEAKEYEEMGRICKDALKLDALDEDLQCFFIKALMLQKKLSLAIEQYKKASDILYEQLGVTPSAELRKVYNELLKLTHEEETCIRAIQVELEDDDLSGAFLCEYGVFKKTYHLEKRRAERFGLSEYLALITVVPPSYIKREKSAYLEVIKEAMIQLEGVLLEVLRAGDVISKYSGSQYIVLLPTCQLETAKLVSERIRSVFETTGQKKMRTKLQFSLEEVRGCKKEL